MDKKLITETIQREILLALSISYPDPLTGKQYFAAFGQYAEPVISANIQDLIKRGLVRKTAIRSCGGVNFITLAELTLDFGTFKI